MSLIAPQNKGPAKEQFTIRLDRPVALLLRRYCQFINSTQDYVLNAALHLTFAKDKEFSAWLATQPEPPLEPERAKSVHKARKAGGGS